MSENVRGMLTLDALRELVEQDKVDTVVAVFTDMYGRFAGKRFDSEYFLDAVASSGTHACDYLLTVDMEMEPVSGYRFANWERGYGDFHLVPDLTSLRWATWLESTTLVICDVHNSDTHDPVSCAPRSILRQQVERAAAAGYEVMAGSELEYYLFRSSYRNAAQQDYRIGQIEPAGWYIEDYQVQQGARTEDFHAVVRRRLKESGVPVECTKGEWGEGQHELNVRYTDVLQMADRHAVYKQCLKEVAQQQELSVTFMAKYAEGRAGSSCHLHLSLWQGEEAVFPGDQPIGALTSSDTFRWFLAGWMEHVPELMVMYAPTVNSYKRFRSASWAPTQVVWSRDNRTAGFRVVGDGRSLRIECRLPGADCNPYLAYAASLASGLDGIRRRAEPPAMFQGDAYQADIRQVPASLSQATDLFADSQFARDTFGEDVVEHYAHFFRMEQQAYDLSVSDWERRRYFERI